MPSLRYLLATLCAALALSGSGCTSFQQQMAPNPHLAVTDSRPRKLFVFRDGTNNNWQTRTNVRRLFELVAAQEDPHRLCCWIEGVGTNRNLLGISLGYGLKDRVEAGYRFLAENYRPATATRPADEIHIFGFSRGAWEARALCGLLAHAGLYAPAPGEKVPAEQIFQAVADLPEEQWPSLSEAEQQHRNEMQIAANHALLNGPRKFRGKLRQDVRVKFLGLWDTVAGFQITKIDGEGEQTKRVRGILTPRYKVRPYANIDQIAHALAIDEQRSQFRPTRVGPPLDKTKTEVFEVWFPGVHSDVGGGYRDSNEIAGISLNWMLELLGPGQLLPGSYTVAENAGGLMHHSELDRFGAIGSKPLPRVLPQGAMVHASFLRRVEWPQEVPETYPTSLGAVTTRYRPDVPMQETLPDGTRKLPVRPFVAKPDLNEPESPEARKHWAFNTALWQQNFKIVTTKQAEDRPLTGKPLSVQATVVQDVKETPLPAASRAVPAPARTIPTQR